MEHSPVERERLPDIIGGFPYAEDNCRGCGKPLLLENAWMTDGCPCNTPLGVNSLNETRWRLLMQLQQKQSRELEAATPPTESQGELAREIMRAFAGSSGYPVVYDDTYSKIVAILSRTPQPKVEESRLREAARSLLRDMDRYVAAGGELAYAESFEQLRNVLAASPAETGADSSVSAEQEAEVQAGSTSAPSEGRE